MYLPKKFIHILMWIDFSILGQYEMGECVRSGFCNFMHLKPISRDLRRELYGRKGSQSGLGQHGSKRDRDSRRRSRSRSRERKRSRSRERRRSRDRAGRSGRYWYYCCFTAFPFANKQFSISLFRSLTYEKLWSTLFVSFLDGKSEFPTS